jgi:hypothetical protein
MGKLFFGLGLKDFLISYIVSGIIFHLSDLGVFHEIPLKIYQISLST